MTKEQVKYRKENQTLLPRLQQKVQQVLNDFKTQKVKNHIWLFSLSELPILTLTDWTQDYSKEIKYNDFYFTFWVTPSWSDQRNLKGTGLRYNYTPTNAYTITICDANIRYIYEKVVYEVVDEYSVITDDIVEDIQKYLDFYISEVKKIPTKIDKTVF